MSDPEPEVPLDRGYLWERAQVANDPDFLQRVRQALYGAAVAIQNEDPGTAMHDQRTRLASQVLQFPDDWTRRIAPAIANNPNVGTGSSDPSVESDTGDQALEYVVTSVWNAFASTMPAT